MKKKMLTVLVLAFVLVFAGAYTAYDKLSASVTPARQLLVQATQEPAATEAPAEDAHSGEDHPAHAPDFTVLDRSGNEVQLSNRIGKPLVLNLWASWCGPCQMEMPAFHEKYEELGHEVEFMMVNMTDGQRETQATATEFVDERGFSFPLYFDTTGEAAYNYGAYSLPMTFFIDAEGHVIAQATGAIDAETLQMGIDMVTA